MDILLLFWGLMLSAACFYASTFRGGAQIRGTVLNYYSLIGVIVLIYQLDFYKLFQEGRSFVAFQNATLTANGISVANTLFLLSISTFLLLSLSLSRRHDAQEGSTQGWTTPTDQRHRNASVKFWIIAFILWMYFLFLVVTAIGSTNMIEFTTRRFLLFADQKILHYVAFWIPPAFCFVAMAYGGRGKFLVVLLLISIVTMVLTGSRDRIIWIVLVYAVSQANRFKIKNRYLIFIIPGVVIFLYGYLAIFRPHQNYDITEVFNPIGMYDYLVTSTEVTVPDNLSSIEEGFAPERVPFSSIVNIITYPIPRAFLGGLKTYGAAVDFTLEMRPEAWLLGRSATTLSGFGELRLEFGYFYPLIAAAILFFWCRLLDGWSFGRTYLDAAKYALGYWILFHFLRTGLSELGNFIWLSLGAYFANLFFSRTMFKGSDRKKVIGVSITCH